MAGVQCDFIALTSDIVIGVQLFDGTVTGVPSGVFAQRNDIDYISLPGTIKTIAGFAFYNCSELQMFPMENSRDVISLGDFAFQGCSKMTFPHSNVVDLRNASGNGVSTFIGCESFGSRDETVPSFLYLGPMIGNTHTFTDCKKLTHILFFGSNGQATDDAVECLKDVGESTFKGCEKLTTVNSYSLRTQTTGNYINLPGVSMDAAGSFGNINKSAFEGCKSIKEVRFGAARIIGDRVFYNCTALEGVTLDGTQNLTQIGDYAFIMCQALEKVGGSNLQTGVSLPAVTTVGEWAFANCWKITSVDLPEATTLVGTVNNARNFSACNTLESVNLPKVTVIPEYCFYNCPSLTSVSLPAATTIEARAFGKCTALTSLSLPSVVSIGHFAFEYTRSLTELEFGPNLTTLGSTIFYDTSDDNAVRNYNKLELTFKGPYPTSLYSAFNSSNPTFGYTGDSQNMFVPKTIWVNEDYYEDYNLGFASDWEQSVCALIRMFRP